MRPSRFVSYRAVLAVVLVSSLAGATPVKAGFVLVTDPNSLGENDSASWSGFDVNNPTVFTTNGIHVRVQSGGINSTLSVSTLSGHPAIEDFGNEFYGTFGPSSEATITLTFSQPVAAAGALMEALEEGNIVGNDPFQIQAFDPNGNSQSFTGGVGGPEFVGIVSDTDNLSKLIINAYAYNANTLLEVGPLELQDSPQVSSVPEPSGLTLASLGMLGLLGCCYWRRCRPAIA
jgi:hypothetical protein